MLSLLETSTVARDWKEMGVGELFVPDDTLFWKGKKEGGDAGLEE